MKKITKILDSVMSRLKRTCVAKAIAVVAVATIAMNSFAQEETITGVKDLPGKDLTYINSHLTTDGNYPEDMSKMFFLYNEATGKFLNIGSYWGTHVALADYGKPLWVIKNNKLLAKENEFYFVHNMATTMTQDQGPYIGWNLPAEGKPAEDTGVYADKKKGDIYGWVLEFVNGDTHNACRLRSKTRKWDKLGIFKVWGDDVYLCGVPSDYS